MGPGRVATHSLILRMDQTGTFGSKSWRRSCESGLEYAEHGDVGAERFCPVWQICGPTGIPTRSQLGLLIEDSRGIVLPRDLRPRTAPAPEFTELAIAPDGLTMAKMPTPTPPGSPHRRRRHRDLPHRQ